MSSTLSDISDNELEPTWDELAVALHQARTGDRMILTFREREEPAAAAANPTRVWTGVVHEEMHPLPFAPGISRIVVKWDDNLEGFKGKKRGFFPEAEVYPDEDFALLGVPIFEHVSAAPPARPTPASTKSVRRPLPTPPPTPKPSRQPPTPPSTRTTVRQSDLNESSTSTKPIPRGSVILSEEQFSRLLANHRGYAAEEEPVDPDSVEESSIVDSLYDKESGMIAPMTSLVLGLRIPRDIEGKHSWLYPHLWLGKGREYVDQIRLTFLEFSCNFKSMTRKADLDLDLELARDLLDSNIEQKRTTKASWRSPFSLGIRITSAILQTSTMGGTVASEMYTAEAKKAFECGRVDLGTLFQKSLQKCAATLTPVAQPVVLPTVAEQKQEKKRFRAGEDDTDFERLQGYIESAVRQGQMNRRRRVDNHGHQGNQRHRPSFQRRSRWN
jgi:hypothetical protein